MIIRPAPVVYPCQPAMLFDALVEHFPDTDQQVLWADRQLGVISGICNGRFHAFENPDRFTIYLRQTADGQTVVTIHIEGAHVWGKTGKPTSVNAVSALVADVASRVAQLR